MLIVSQVLTVGELKHTPVIRLQYTIRSDMAQLSSNEIPYTWSVMTTNWTACSALCQGSYWRLNIFTDCYVRTKDGCLIHGHVGLVDLHNTTFSPKYWQLLGTKTVGFFLCMFMCNCVSVTQIVKLLVIMIFRRILLRFHPIGNRNCLPELCLLRRSSCLY